MAMLMKRAMAQMNDYWQVPTIVRLDTWPGIPNKDLYPCSIFPTESPPDSIIPMQYTER